MNTGRFALYSDFNCPFCYALHERLHDLNLLDRCEWRGVQHAPHLPRPMKPWQGGLAAELRHEVAIVQRLAPGLPMVLPPGKPHTGAAIDRAIVLLRQDRVRGMDFVRQAYGALWREGEDLSDPRVLDRLAAVPLKETNADDALRTVREWESAWQATGQAGVPLIVSPDGDFLVGSQPAERIVEFFHR
jgi:predicted DsbA family dithiol-disulfide isomerase